MKTKRNYISPQIKEVKLDNQISLQLASHSHTPPPDPFGAAPQRAPGQAQAPEQFGGSNPWEDTNSWGK